MLTQLGFTSLHPPDSNLGPIRVGGYFFCQFGVGDNRGKWGVHIVLFCFCIWNWFLSIYCLDHGSNRIWKIQNVFYQKFTIHLLLNFNKLPASKRTLNLPVLSLVLTWLLGAILIGSFSCPSSGILHPGPLWASFSFFLMMESTDRKRFDF